MKPKLHMAPVILPFALFVVLCLLLSPSPSYSQGLSSWFSAGTWWDWSDYRFKMEYRFFAPQLTSGSFKRGDREYDLLASPSPPNSQEGGYNFDHQPPPFNSATFQLQVDRLGLRLTIDEDLIFRGFLGLKNLPPSPPAPSQDDYYRVSELDLSSTRVGICLDLIRYPFLRGGIDFDMNVNGVTFYDAKAAVNPSIPPGATTYDLIGDRFFKSSNPVTIGLHVFAIPARVREVPIIVQAKINFPFPYWKQIWGLQYEAKMFEWEVMAGARPAVWDASVLGLSTFSLGVEAGFRSVTLDAEFQYSASVHAQWQGPFFQVGLYY